MNVQRPEAAASIHVGVAVEIVDVPAGTPMAGFAARLSTSTGVHDPLTARAIVLGDVGLVAIDVCALHEDTCRLIEKQSGLPHVVVSATHTHSGPCVAQGRVGQHDAAVHREVITASVNALARARAAQRPVTAEWLAARDVGVAKDRRHLERIINPPVQGVVFRDVESREPQAVIASYPCHPVVLDATNTLVTGDYVHFFRERVERHWGAPVVFLTGTCGDVNTGHRAQASYGDVRGAGRTFSEAERCGSALADALIAAAPHAVDLAGGVTATSLPVELAYASLTAAQVEADKADWLRQRADAPAGLRKLLDIWIDWADRWSPDSVAGGWTGRVSRIAIGSFDLITLPGEPFLRVAEDLRGDRDDMIVAGYSDGVPGYFPMAEDYVDGGYEVCDAHRYYAMPAPFASGSAERLVLAAGQLLEG